MSNFDLVIKNGNCWVEGKWQKRDLGILNGKIVAIEAPDSIKNSNEIWDVQGNHVFPGVIDSQVHFREPGSEHKEDLATGTKGALLGGVTTVFEMPNTNPTTTNKEAFNDKIERAKNRVFSNIGFFIGATPSNAEKLKELEVLPGCVGVKVFMGKSTGDLLVHDDELLKRVLSSGKRRVAVHCEDQEILDERFPSKPVDVSYHPIWRNEESAFRATRRLLKWAKEFGRPVHVLHVTTEEEMSYLEDYKDIATVEVTPQHLYFSSPDCYEKLGSKAQMNPPIRETRHREGLWRGVKNRTVDVIGSDHAPHTLEEKAKPYPESPSGMTGVQTFLPILLNFVSEGKIELDHLVELVCETPCKLYGLENKGKISIGYDADLTVVDLNMKKVIRNEDMATKSKWTPYDGVEVKGWPIGAVVSGEVAMKDGSVIGSPKGKICQFSVN